MFDYFILKNYSGFMLVGDYKNLRDLHQVVHDINERSPLIKNKEGLFLNLAYDARKAYERQREIIVPPKEFEEIGVRYGVQQILPVILLQCRMMRTSLSYLDHSKIHQAMTYALEDVLEGVLKEIFRGNSQQVIERWNGINLAIPGVFELLYGRTGLFCSWSKNERKKRFLNLLESFVSNYDVAHRHRFQHGEMELPTPGEFAIFEGLEWPDPK